MSKAENDFLFRVDGKVDELGERVSKIEGKLDENSQKGFKKTLSESGGLVALILSITIGSFTLYDKLVLQPEKEIIQQEVNFRNNLNELATIAGRIAGLDWTNNPQAAQIQAQAFTPQKQALLETLKKSDSNMPNVLLFADRLFLANEYANYGWIQEALDQAELAQQSARDVMQSANAYWARARFSAGLNNFTEMRELYLLALSEFMSLGLKNTASSVMQVYLQWISIELINGTCATAQDVHSKMLDHFKSPDVWQSTRQWTRFNFSQMLSQAPKSCDLSITD